MKKLENKTVIITGAGSGIGKCIAQLFASEGAEILIGDINFENAQKTCNEIADQTKKIPFHLDVTSEESVQKLAESAKKRIW